MPTEKHTWILLRGLAREKGHWGPFIEKFAASQSGDEVLALDLPGAGEFRETNSPLTIDGIFNFVRREAITRARNQGQFKLLAVSLGGMVAMEWMRQKPQDLAACVLINTSASNLSPFYQRLRWQVWKDVLRLISVQSMRDRERGIIDLIINSEEAREAAWPLWTKIALERPIAYKNFFAQLVAASRFAGMNSGADIPTLLLNGLGDRLVDPSCSTQLHERTGWPIRRHAWAGHDLPWDDPQWVIERISEWNVTLK